MWGRTWVILGTVMGYQDWVKVLEVHIEESEQDNSPNCSQAIGLLCSTRERVKREEKEILPRQTILSLYTAHQPPSNHPTGFDVPSELPTMISHNITYFLINKTMPPHLTLQHLRPFPYHNKLYRHHYTASSNVFAFL